MDVRDAIRGYINHVSDPAFVNAVLSEPASVVFKTLQEMLFDRATDREDDDRHWASLFIGDACRYGNSFGQFRRRLLDSRVMPALRELGLSGDFVGRGHAVEALGRIGGRVSADVLTEIFERYISRDPLLLARILATVPIHVYEDDRWALMRRLASSDLYLIRWVLLSTNGTILGFPMRARDNKRARGLLRSLSNDSVSWVAKEALHRHKEWVLEAEGRGMSSVHWTDEMIEEGFSAFSIPPAVQALRRQEPKLTFESIESRFHNHMYKDCVLDYSISDLDQFVHGLAAEFGAVQ